MPTESYEFRGQSFEWDRDKNLRNIEKHGITFKMAALAFFDPNAEAYEDEGHSHDEDRFIIIGFGENNKIMTVCHCYREDEKIRIISARKATKSEEELYGGAF